MIRILKDGVPFELGDIKITFRLRSPLFNDVPSHTFSFDLPATDHNIALTGYLHRATSNTGILADIPVTADVHGWMLGATMRVQSASKQVISVFLAIDNGQLNVDWGDKMLQEVDFDTVEWFDGSLYLNEKNKELDSDNAVCQFPPMTVSEYFDSKEVNYQNIINSYSPEESEYDLNFVSDTDGVVWNITACVPMFYLKHIIKWVCEKNGILYKDSIFNLPEFKNLIIFNNACIDEKRRYDYFRASKTEIQDFPDGFGKCLFDDATTPPNHNDGPYNTSTSEYNITRMGIHEFIISLDVDYAEGNTKVLKIDQTSYDVVVGPNLIKHSQFYADADVNKKIYIEVASFTVAQVIMYKPIGINAGSYFSGRNASHSDLALPYYNITIDPANHLPEIKIKDLFSWLSIGFGAIPVFNSNSRTLIFKFWKDILLKPAIFTIDNIEPGYEFSPEATDGFSFEFDTSNDDAPIVADISDYQYIGDYNFETELPFPDTNNQLAYVKSAAGYFIYLWDDATQKFAWTVFSDYLYLLKTGNFENEIKVPWHPPSTTKYNTISDLGYIPNIGCKGSSQYFGVGLNKSPLLLMHYYGIQHTIRNWSHMPFASGTVYNNLGEKIGTLHLGFDTADGLYEKFWKPVEAFYRNRWKLTAKKQTDAAFLRQIDWAEKYLTLGREFLLDTVEFTATAQGFGPATIEAYRCP